MNVLQTGLTVNVLQCNSCKCIQWHILRAAANLQTAVVNAHSTVHTTYVRYYYNYVNKLCNTCSCILFI